MPVDRHVDLVWLVVSFYPRKTRHLSNCIKSSVNVDDKMSHGDVYKGTITEI